MKKIFLSIFLILFLSSNVNADWTIASRHVNGTTEFYNELTRRNDPINAPKFKWNINFNYKNDKYGMLSIGYRHVDQFEWQDGIWSGIIGPYNLFDIHYKYDFNDYLSTSISCLNIFNDVHREIVGGAKMGRQIVMRFSTGF